jgi:hypothetical protein
VFDLIDRLTGFVEDTTQMNQPYLQSYIDLIQQLLACPGGEEWIVLRQHEALVNPELVQVMEQVATQLAAQKNLKEAKFLHNLAGQIHHLFVAQTVQPPSPDDKSQAYLDLIQALLECPQDSEGDVFAAYPTLLGPGLVNQMQQVAKQLAVNGDQEAAQYLQQWAAKVNQLWVKQHSFLPMLEKTPEPKHPEPEHPDIPSRIPDRKDEDVWAEPSEVPKTTPQPIAIQLVQPAPIASPAAEALRPALTTDEQISHHLETIAKALTHLSATFLPPPTNPLWYMAILEQAQAGNWLLTSTEVHQLIGVKPSCTHESESFQRGCWRFVKAGKLGTQISWRVDKATELAHELSQDQPS